MRYYVTSWDNDAILAMFRTLDMAKAFIQSLGRPDTLEIWKMNENNDVLVK